MPDTENNDSQKTDAAIAIANGDGPQVTPVPPQDIDPIETKEWLDSLEYVLNTKGPERVKQLLAVLDRKARQAGVELPYALNTPYINTIHHSQQPRYPGNRELERRIKSIIRWNAMAMVHRANKHFDSLGGHISTFASSATLYEVGFNHFFRGRGDDGYSGDLVYFQGHASPGMYARAFLEGRLTEENLEYFRRELQPTRGLSSYPHPWLMPDFWEFPTVSMGLGPIMAIYQARFNEYLKDRGIRDTGGRKVWCFVGDGETDEPETLGAITLAGRELLDNLIFVVNCNLQRLDGPVRGNGKIIQELEGLFIGAGWNVIKVIWGDDWDPLLDKDDTGLLVKRMGECVDGQYQKYKASDGKYIREHFFGKYPELLKLIENLSDEKLSKLRRGGHDPEKVFAAFQAAVECKGKPTVILAKTIKGYGLGEAGEGRNIAHNNKKLNEEELYEFRTRFGIPISDDDVANAPFYKPPETSAEMKYLRERREALGGSVPGRPTTHPRTEVPRIEEYKEFLGGSQGKEMSTTMAFVRLLRKLCRDKKIGNFVVPIVPDESRTFGMEGMFGEIGIYSHVGQLYEPVDSEQIAKYKESINGQILEEGITEAGSMSSFCAAGTSYSSHGINMIPFYIYYSMFGFQRIGDLIWAAQDMRAKGFLLGGTAGRTTLNGEGLQHQDGHSLLNAIAFPNVRSYDPAYAYEMAIIVLDGMRKLYEEGDTAIYYLMSGNENYVHPAMPVGIEEGIVRGMYKLKSLEIAGAKAKVNLFGSGAILRHVLAAQELLAERFHIASTVWSVTSYTQLRRDAHVAERWNMLHPAEPPRKSYVEETLSHESGVFVAASDYVRSLPEQISRWVPGDYYVLGTDGLGRSETRETLRRHFEVDAECIALATLYRLQKQGRCDASFVAKAIADLGVNPEKVDPYFASMAIEIKLPDLGDGIDTGDVLELLVKEGDIVTKDQGIIELETGKATLQVPSSAAGKVSKIHVKAGQTIPPGTLLLTLEGAEAAAKPKTQTPAPPAAQPPKPKPAEAKKEPTHERPVSPSKPARAPEPPPPHESAPVPPDPIQNRGTRDSGSSKTQNPPAPEPRTLNPEPSSAPTAAGPAVRRFAREVGVDLSRVTGSGSGGRITREDVLAVVRQQSQSAATAKPSTATARDQWGPIRPEKMSKIRKTIAAKMHESWTTCPRVTNFDDADVTELERLRVSSKDDYAKKCIKLTSLPFVIKAVASALKHHPAINASLDPDGEQVIYKEYVNIGIAVDTERGLVVPSLRGADELSIPDIARSLAQLSENVRDGSFSVADLQGSTFTISNLGAIGGTYSTPIINTPEVAILLVGRSRKMPVVMDEEIAVRLMMPLSLAYDHRLVDGATAARFLNDVIDYLEAPSRLLLAP